MRPPSVDVHTAAWKTSPVSIEPVATTVVALAARPFTPASNPGVLGRFVGAQPASVRRATIGLVGLLGRDADAAGHQPDRADREGPD